MLDTVIGTTRVSKYSGDTRAGGGGTSSALVAPTTLAPATTSAPAPGAAARVVFQNVHELVGTGWAIVAEVAALLALGAREWAQLPETSAVSAGSIANAAALCHSCGAS